MTGHLAVDAPLFIGLCIAGSFLVYRTFEWLTARAAAPQRRGRRG